MNFLNNPSTISVSPTSRSRRRNLPKPVRAICGWNSFRVDDGADQHMREERNEEGVAEEAKRLLAERAHGAEEAVTLSSR